MPARSLSRPETGFIVQDRTDPDVECPGRPVRGGVFGVDGRECRLKGSGSFDMAAGVVRVRVPRACLGDPAWVRPGAGVATLQGGEPPGRARPGTLPGEWKLGPRMPVG